MPRRATADRGHRGESDVEFNKRYIRTGYGADVFAAMVRLAWKVARERMFPTDERDCDNVNAICYVLCNKFLSSRRFGAFQSNVKRCASLWTVNRGTASRVLGTGVCRSEASRLCIEHTR